MNSVMCMICGHGGHEVSHCPALIEDLRVGFYRGGGGGGGHVHDDEEDENAKISSVSKTNEYSRKMGQFISKQCKSRKYYTYQTSRIKYKFYT